MALLTECTSHKETNKCREVVTNLESTSCCTGLLVHRKYTGQASDAFRIKMYKGVTAT